MRELRKDVDSRLEPSKDEVDSIDEIKIEDVLMGLKGLKQEEVFSFLGKSNFTPAETEEWLKMMSSSGFSGHDHLSTVDPVDIEQFQLSFGAHFDGLQSSTGHHTCSPKSDLLNKLKVKNELKAAVHSFETVSKTHGVAPEWETVDIQQPRVSSTWPKYPGTHAYSLDDFHEENLREEEIIATSIGEEMISTSNVDDEDEFKYVSPNNSYVIQSSVDRVDVSNKPKPIKLLIKRVESEDELLACPDSDSSVTRAKSKRVWNSSSKRKVEKSPPKKRKCTRRSMQQKVKEKVDASAPLKKEPELYKELEFPLPNTVHQDDEFVYPSLISDDEEEDVYSFNQRDDETWTPKIKMKINEVKPQRPTRNRKQNSVVAKYLEAAALKRADCASNKSSKKLKRKLPSNVQNGSTHPSTNALQDRIVEYTFDVATCSQLSPMSSHLLPSTSTTSTAATTTTILKASSLPQTPPLCRSLTPGNAFTIVQSSLSDSSAAFSSPSSSEFSLSSPNTLPARRGRKANPKPGPKGHKGRKLHLRADFKGSRLIPPKTCKLLQTSRGSVVTSLHPAAVSTKQRVKDDSSQDATAAAASSSPSNSGKKVPASFYVTKRGKPKKGMATAKQRLGKILKMHKMFF